ncbi:RNA polymerase sigma factor RpoD/SigA [Nanoarchaeota archaeon]
MPEEKEKTTQGDAMLKLYMTDVGDFPVLRRAEEVALAKKIEDRHMRLVFDFCSYRGRTTPSFPGLSVLEVSLSKAFEDEGQHQRYKNLKRRLDYKKRKSNLEQISAEIFAMIPEHRIEIVRSAAEYVVRHDQVNHELVKSLRGDLKAAYSRRNEFAQCNLKYVISIAKRFQGRGILLKDLIQEGNIGLLKGIDRFDYRLGYKFSTYAAWWIRHAMGRAIADKARAVRLPVYVTDYLNDCRTHYGRQFKALGRIPTPYEVVESMIEGKPTQRQIDKYIEMMQVPTVYSYDEPVNDEVGHSFMDFLGDTSFEHTVDDIATQELFQKVRAVMSKVLTSREREVLEKRYLLDEPQTLKQIAQVYDLSRERIRQLQEIALEKVRRRMTGYNMN